MATQIEIEALKKRLLTLEEKLSYSALSNFAESPQHFIEYKFKERVATEAMIYGRVLHCLVLEPGEFNKRYAIAPKCDMRTNDGKQTYADFCAGAAGKEVITDAINIKAMNAARALRNNSPARMVINRMDEKEVGIEWEYMNFNFHGFIDGRKSGHFIADLKSCANAEPRKFQRDIIQMDYHVQAAMYLTGSEPGSEIDVPYYIIAVDGDGGVSVHLLDERVIKAGLERYAFLMESLNRCILEDAFDKSYDFYADRRDGVFKMEKPSWLY